ncbi:hypothetical protein [Haliscomenobacter hydrossis]|uniref:Uncharacterized protein n=1 Tax=Haliscomenobacter hydrossis (strain ATCC 27775 / DSM 1100 / LMG 10767 / O) TaxID=760192 RepID=F4KZT0_HALH1|nr:hypothetical protein [Haliscomenobacter hydrossis]AEE50516.1 hypothetical protein Halhy_2647 [Haliscomenobacter hydrossis DSM 1100]
MKKNNHKYRVGYIDEESVWVANFTRKLKNDFDIVTFELTEELTLDDITNQIKGKKLDCLVVDFELNETDVVQFNGDEIIDNLRKAYPFFPVFIITSKEEDYVLEQVEDNDIVRLKEELVDRPKILTQRIKNKIERYYSQIHEAENIIESLIKKKNIEGLTILEEEILTEQYMFLEKIYPEEKFLPDSLIQPNNITKLNEFASEAKQILEELKKLNK